MDCVIHSSQLLQPQGQVAENTAPRYGCDSRERSVGAAGHERRAGVQHRIHRTSPNTNNPMEEEHRKQLPSHHLWKLTDILNLARIGERQEKKAAEGDRGILLAVNSKAGMELAQLPMQNYPFCHGDLLRQAVESSSEDSVPTACICLFPAYF